MGERWRCKSDLGGSGDPYLTLDAQNLNSKIHRSIIPNSPKLNDAGWGGVYQRLNRWRNVVYPYNRKLLNEQITHACYCTDEPQKHYARFLKSPSQLYITPFHKKPQRRKDYRFPGAGGEGRG